MIDALMAKTGHFHGLVDDELVYWPEQLVAAKKGKYIVIQEREVSYRFYLHQHPYVTQLLQRLVRKGTPGLQGADTEYQTRIRLSNATAAQGANGATVQLAAGEILHLADGATATMDGHAVRFAGNKVLKLPGESPITPAPNKNVTIAGKTAVRRSNGAHVTLETSATARLVDGAPVPVLYADFFAARYDPNPDLVPDTPASPRPVMNLDFTSRRR